MESRKAELGIQDLWPIALIIIVVGIGAAYGMEITGDVRDDIGATNCAARTDDFTGYSTANDLCLNATNTSQTGISVGTAEFNATGNSITGVGNLTGKLPTIATIVAAAVIIGVLVRNFMSGR